MDALTRVVSSEISFPEIC